MLETPIVSYRGPLTFSTIDQLLSEFKIAAGEHRIAFRTYKKMISVMIEALENISKYSDEFECSEKDKRYCPTFDINSSEDVLELITSNPVRLNHVESLRSRIDRVNDQAREELKELYRSTITNGEFSPKGGAGLGFIEMAKTSGSKLEYKFDELSEDFARYTFRVILER